MLQADILETLRMLWQNVFISFCYVISLMSPDRLTASFSEGFSSALSSFYFQLYTDSQRGGLSVEVKGSPFSNIPDRQLMEDLSGPDNLGQCEHAADSPTDYKSPAVS